MIFLSIVIPAYNSQDTIIPLLDSIKNSRKADFGEMEVIIVDDCSHDSTAEVSLTFFRTSQTRSTSSASRTRGARGRGRAQKANFLAVESKIIKLKTNQGPAKARNIGVKYASGRAVLFLDADVVLYKNTLFEIVKSFKNDPDLYALTGVWDKKQNSRKFFPKFKALRDWSYWINERDPKNYYYLFSTRIAVIDRGLFLRLGGFDTTYKGALVEDIELTYRIARRHAVVFNPKVIVHHEFEDFTTVAKKYFWRSFYWSKIYRERKKFDPVATTGKEAMTTISAGGVVGVIILWGAVRVIREMWGAGELWGIEKLFFVLCSLFFTLHLFGVRKFLFFAAREEGIIFAVKSFFVGIALYIAILAGAAISFIGAVGEGK